MFRSNIVSMKEVVDSNIEPTPIYQKPNLLLSWIRWHGPYKAFDDWVAAAKSYRSVEEIRIYLALGRAQRFSIKKPSILYIGLNSRDAHLNLDQEIQNKKNNGRQKFGGSINEYWVGELMSDWERAAVLNRVSDEYRAEIIEIDTQNAGLTKNTERALIYSLNPTQNHTGYKDPPDFSFRIINTLCNSDIHRPQTRRLFKKLLPSYLEYDSKSSKVSVGEFQFSITSSKTVEEIRNEINQEETKKGTKLERLHFLRQIFSHHPEE